MLGMSISSGEAAALRDVAWLLAPANAGKQPGLYTDFDPDFSSWTAPGTVTSAEFEKIRAVAGDFVARDAAPGRRVQPVPAHPDGTGRNSATRSSGRRARDRAPG
jgi:hypothetical protein